jgi:hypothetical protein
LPDSAVTDLVLAPLLPWPLLAALAAVLLALVAWAAWRRARGVWARLAAGAVLLAVLLNPQGVTERRAPLPDVAVVAVDESFSNTLADRPAQTRAALDALRAGVAEDPTVTLRVVPVADGAADRGTRLMGAVRQALADVPAERRAGVVALTDGRVHDGDTLSADALGAPFHLLLTGDPEARDRRLMVEAAPAYGLVGRSLETTVRLDDPALGDGEPVTLTLRRDGQPAGTVTVPANRSTSVTLPLERAGETVFELTSPAVPDDLTTVNDGAALTVTGVRDRLRVLLISGEPHAGERVWRNLLKADPNVDLIHFTILRPPFKDDATPLRELALITFPIQELFEQQLDNFDLVIFDRYSRRGLIPLRYLANVAKAVEDGGALLMAVGPEVTDPVSLYDTPLARVLPVELTRATADGAFRPLPTPDGRRHPVTAGLPGAADGADGGPTWGPWARVIEASPTGGRTLLADAAGRPVLHLSRAGQGRVGLLLSDSAWLWSKGIQGGGPLAELLRRTAHWLMKEPDLEEDALTARAEGDALTITRRGMDPDTLPSTATVTDPAGLSHTVDLADQGDGRAVGTLPAPLPGVYTLSDGTMSDAVVVGAPNPLETAEVAARAAPLDALAAATGGGVHWLGREGMPEVRRVSADSRTMAGEDWIGLRTGGAYRVDGVDQSPLLPPWLALLLAFGTLGWAWWREGR